ncbi:uncharacterized protein LOC142504956 [Primulina tabacum]|uniref:uncharacterized protein LOC142504956 n=1 Tax=Primulina tabacum TaxID=48773 RepID=UPI003F5A9422
MYRSDHPREEKSNLEQMMSNFILSPETRLQNQDASIKGLENQIGQLAKIIESREPATLPSNTGTNSKKQVQDIEFKSGKILESKEKERSQVPDEQSETSKDFVVLDMEEDMEMPLILGRPFLATGKALIDVQEGKLRLRVGEEEITFDNALRDPLESTLTTELREEELDAEKAEIVAYLNANQQWKRSIRMRLEDLGDRRDLIPPKPSLEEPPTLELKPLPPHLKYVYLGENNKLPVIISSYLTDVMEDKLLKVLKAHNSAFAWKVADIKGINPSVCMHKKLIEEKYSPLVQPQRRLNPKMQEVVKTETIKLLDACIIYPISDSAWVSLVQCVPKKDGITVITNEQNELISTRKVTGWCVCIDYRKLNDATRKDHFPLPFIDQILERLAGHEFYCFLDGYSGYNKIMIAPEDQEKTTFTCPYGTFAFRRMPFGLCNVPATSHRCITAIFHDMIETFLEIFTDDFSIFGSSFDDCLQNLKVVLM